jgi:hypothetical protein
MNYTKFKERQQRAFQATKRSEVTVLEAERGGGKSFWLFWSAIIYLAEHAGTNAILFARSRELAIATFMGYVKDIPEATYAKYEDRIELKNGSSIYLMGIDQREKYCSMQALIVGIDNMDTMTKKDFDSAYERHRWPGLEAKVLVTQTRHPVYPSGTTFIS